jgi:aspartyl/asparaginyl beta-hydroxylase (cupin superfamily)
MTNFYDITEFPHLNPFIEHFDRLRSELISAIQQGSIFEPWCEIELYAASNPDGWEVAPLMIDGVRDITRCVRLPYLTSILDQIEGIVTVSYSLLRPGTRITLHRGYNAYSDRVLRYHLGMIVPDGEMGLRVRNTTKRWREGEGLVFDDTNPHEAWNLSTGERVVLMIDFCTGKYTPELDHAHLSSRACTYIDKFRHDSEDRTTNISHDAFPPNCLRAPLATRELVPPSLAAS